MKSSQYDEVRNLRCELVSGQDVSMLEGRIKTIIESFGLPDRQEKSGKDIVNTILWNWFNCITNEDTDHLKEKKSWYEEKSIFPRISKN